MVIAGKPVRAIIEAGKHRDSAPDAEQPLCSRELGRRDETTSDTQRWGVEDLNPHPRCTQFPVGDSLLAATDLPFCDPGQIALATCQG